MNNLTLTPTTEVNYKGKVAMLLDIAIIAGYDPIDAKGIIALGNALLKRGDITIVDKRTQQEKNISETVKSTINEVAFGAIVDNIEAEEQAHKQFIREQKLQNTGTHTFDLEFVTTLEATKFEMWVKGLGIKQTAIFKDDKTGAIKLLIQEVSPMEYTRITTKYSAENAINNTMQATGKVITGATDAVNYGLANVVAPTAKIAGEAGMNLAKGIFHVGAKTLAGLVNSGAKAVTDTKVALMTDPECLKATNQLMNAKNDIKRGVATKLGNSTFSNGITHH